MIGRVLLILCVIYMNIVFMKFHILFIGITIDLMI